MWSGQPEHALSNHHQLAFQLVYQLQSVGVAQKSVCLLFIREYNVYSVTKEYAKTENSQF